MSKINDLISTLCPDGVPFKRLGEIGNFYSGLSGKSKDDFIKDGNAVLITYMNVYSNLELKTDVKDRVRVGENEKQNTVQYGDVLFTGSSETPDECGMSSVLTTHTENKLYLNSFCFGYRFDKPGMFLPEFTKHLFRSDNLRNQITKTASGVTRFNVSKKKMENVKIPVPPLEVQREIVRVLDNFTLLTAELTAELTARRKQYEYYKDKLLSFDADITTIPLANIAEIGTGSSNTNEAVKDGKYPFFVRSQIPLLKNEYEYDETAIITAGDGVGVGKVFHYVEGKYALHQRAYRIHIVDKRVLSKYAFYYIQAKFYDYISKAGFHSSVSSIRRPMLNAFEIPLPAIGLQKEIIKALDNFDKVCNDISIGLPAEIAARQKQYEYYRDKLLTFKEAR